MKSLFLSSLLFVGFFGFANPSLKIIGGEAIGGQQAPWQLSLKSRSGSHYCAAVLIKKDVALTAAHCVDMDSASDLRIYGGSSSGNIHRLRSLPSARKLELHPNYNPNDVTAHDIAVIVLRKEINESETLRPISILDSSSDLKLDEQFHNMTETSLLISGWGADTPPNRFPSESEQLLRATLKPVASSNVGLQLEDVKTYLEDSYGIGERTRARIKRNNSRTLLADGYSGRAGTCAGDSGGPLVMFIDDTPTLIGVSSYTAGGERQCTGVSVFSNVQAYSEWIQSVSDPQ